MTWSNPQGSVLTPIGDDIADNIDMHSAIRLDYLNLKPPLLLRYTNNNLAETFNR